MSIPTLVLGKSGSGKTASLMNFEAEKVALMQMVRKPLPFKAKGWTPYVTDHWSNIIGAMRKTQREIIILDDFQYLLANEFMRRSDERGFDKFTDLGRHAWEVLTAAASLPDHVRVYILSHTEETDSGQIKMKTIGKMLDEKITLEGLVTIVLRAIVQDGDHYFSTKNNGSDTVKTPMGMFDSALIPNDLAAVDAAIVDYYQIQSKAA